MSVGYYYASPHEDYYEDDPHYVPVTAIGQARPNVAPKAARPPLTQLASTKQSNSEPVPAELPLEPALKLVPRRKWLWEKLATPEVEAIEADYSPAPTYLEDEVELIAAGAKVSTDLSKFAAMVSWRGTSGLDGSLKKIRRAWKVIDRRLRQDAQQNRGGHDGQNDEDREPRLF